MKADKATLYELRERIGLHLIKIEDMFTSRPEITLIIRQPSYPDGSRDVLMTTEKDIETAITAARRVNADEDSCEIKANSVGI